MKVVFAQPDFPFAERTIPLVKRVAAKLGMASKLPSVMIEIRQDEIRDTAAAATWAARLADAYRQIETEALKIWRS